MDCDVILSHDKCLLQAHSQTSSLVLGKLDVGLYAVDSKDSTGSSHDTSVNLAAHEEAKLWHLRLGHLPFNKLHYANSMFSVNNCCPNNICLVCPKAKQARKPFPISNSMSSHCFDLLHVDVWGPYRVKTYDECTYFLTVVMICQGIEGLFS